MFKLDNAFLEELGLGGLPPVEKNKMLAHIYETLEMRVGMRLAEQMTNEQLDEFESYINRQDESGALKWLETNFPNYKQVVAEELEKLKAEVKQVAPQIVAQAAQDQNLQASTPQAQPSLTQQQPNPASSSGFNPLPVSSSQPASEPQSYGNEQSFPQPPNQSQSQQQPINPPNPPQPWQPS